MAEAPLAVFDLGKTNSKLFVFSASGDIIGQSRTTPRWVEREGLRVLDEAGLYRWMQRSLAEAVAQYDIGGVMFSGHGCAFALVAGDELIYPILDYEQEPPPEVAHRIDDILPSFAETFTPRLPLGLNTSRHILWLEEIAPDTFARAEHILFYPQFWGWRFSGVPASEVSYFGCHSHLWAPMRKDFSSLVDARGWRGKMPPFARAGAVLGTSDITLPSGEKRQIAVHNGVHDSNASLYCYHAAGHDSFTLVSSGTWVIVFNADCPLEKLDEQRDMLANVSVDGVATPTIRFMGGREFDVIRGDAPHALSVEALQAVIDRQVFALPSFAAGGPVPETTGEIVGQIESDAERTAVALLYIVMMTELCLDLIGSENTVIVDGGLVKTGYYAEALAQLRPHQKVLSSENPEGSATGAAILAFEAMGRNIAPVQCVSAEPTQLRGLEAYRARWREMVEERREQAAKGEAAAV